MSESDVYRRQILMTRVDPHAVRVVIHTIKIQVYNCISNLPIQVMETHIKEIIKHVVIRSSTEV